MLACPGIVAKEKGSVYAAHAWELPALFSSVPLLTQARVMHAIMTRLLPLQRADSLAYVGDP